MKASEYFEKYFALVTLMKHIQQRDLSRRYSEK